MSLLTDNGATTMDLHGCIQLPPFPPMRRRIRPRDVLEMVLHVYKLDRERFCGRSRARILVEARGMYAMLAHALGGYSYPDIAFEAGKTAHSTFIDADKRFRRKLDQGRPSAIVNWTCQEALTAVKVALLARFDAVPVAQDSEAA